MYTKGHYEFNVKITDADGKTCYASKSTDFRGLYFVITPAVAGPQKVGTTVDFSVELFNYYYYKFPNYTYWSVTKNGETYKCEDKGYKMSFTPTEAGDYEITFNMPTYMGTAVSETINYKIIDENSNVATVYYKNTSWDNANIHFKPDNGSWTTAPEVKMEASDIEDYTWKYSIDLGDAKAATVCFNDGNGNWDSNYGQNYRIEAGRYGVKFVNQQPDSYNSYSFEIKRGNGSEYYRASVNDGIATVTWIPAMEGTYQIKDGKIFKLAD